jgi:hypothetical protein
MYGHLFDRLFDLFDHVFDIYDHAFDLFDQNLKYTHTYLICNKCPLTTDALKSLVIQRWIQGRPRNDIPT